MMAMLTALLAGSLSTVGAAAAAPADGNHSTSKSHAVPLFRHHALGVPSPMRAGSSESASASVSQACTRLVP